MQVYQIHKCSGECEDAYDYIVGTYIREELANKEMDRLIKAEKERRKQVIKCWKCPKDDEHTSKKVIERYCKNYKTGSGDLSYCANYDYQLDNIEYRMETEKVICEEKEGD